MKKPFGRNKSLRFTTQEKDSAKKRHIFLLSFIIFVLVFGSFSIIYLLKEYNYDLSQMMGTGEATTKENSNTTTTAKEVKLSGDATFLLVGTSTDKTKIYFISIVYADLSNVQFSVCSLSPDTTVKVSDEDKSFTGYYTEGGMKQLKTAVEKYSGIKIDRYAGTNEKKFKNVIKLLGNYEINLDHNISYKGSDFSLNLTKGKQSMSGESLINYIRYVGLGYSSSALHEQSNVIGSMIDQMLNVSNVAKGENLFNGIINLVDSDISVMDYSNNKDYLDAIVESSDRKESKAVSISELKFVN